MQFSYSSDTYFSDFYYNKNIKERRKAANGKDMLLHRYASFAAKLLLELSSFNDFPAGAAKRHEPEPLD
ncbi:hypothetical protein BBH88_15750 [Planococcus antarcticus DSM 14505]|uniref:Uncharacterized protein n=1 Tax=Planococcus antarcticus DSM 14505 TaxID=1185653 RepID=A0ABN4RI20_9BACL|nr:hypothetical protein BBH88_15750 [Planococcus antarcticus DSM 14505]